MHDPVTDLVVALFSQPGAALWLAAGILVFALYLAISSSVLEQRPLVQALVDRCNMLFAIGGRRAFSEQFDAIDQRFGRADSPPTLTRGWKAYRALLAREDDGVFAAAFPAAEVFEPLDEPARVLEWWANILVAVGLVITFLGIVAALSQATSAIAAAGAHGAGVEQALLGLLAIAATKFWTSIAGVLGSILLRLLARLRRRRIEGLQADLFQALDASVDFSPPERVMFDQLAVLRRIEARLDAMTGITARGAA